MIRKLRTTNWAAFFIRIILPACMTIGCFIAALYAFIIPAFENSIIDRKREMIRELTNAAHSILADYRLDEENGRLTRGQAQAAASARIRHLRYGAENKDYFWITDMAPVMIMHPYRADLEGRSLETFRDPHGKRMFVDFKEIASRHGEGYSNYMWQWKDDSTRIVPKLSFVKEFEPWGWIIGTGIYTEDVKAEIAKLERHIIRISLLITAAVSLLLAFIMRQSMRIERKRQCAAADLKESRERYKALVEASSEGSLIMFEDYIYANRTILELLGYDEDELSRMKIGEIITGSSLFPPDGGHAGLLRGIAAPAGGPAALRRKHGGTLAVTLAVTRTAIAGRDALIIIIREPAIEDGGSPQSEAARQRFSHITESLRIGFFRATLARRSHFVEANAAAAGILGFRTKNELLGSNIEALFADPDDRKRVVKELITTGQVRKRVIRITRRDMGKAYILASLTMVRGAGSEPRYCDGLVEDFTAEAQTQSALDEWIREAGSTRNLMNRPVQSLAAEPVSVHGKTAIREAARIAERTRRTALLVHEEPGEFSGIVTAGDFRRHLADAGAGDGAGAVRGIMASPLITISGHALLWEALVLMKQRSVDHLVVRDPGGGPARLLGRQTIADGCLDTGEAAMARDIRGALHCDELALVQTKLQLLVAALAENGVAPATLTRLISRIAEAIIVRVNELALGELGPPPVPYAFISMGSVGREEQTLATDQDNAIIHRDAPDADRERVTAYFQQLGDLICGNLHAIGYAFCKGGIMARNPKYRQPLSAWKSHFARWVFANTPKDLLEFNIFFDFRLSYGDPTLVDELREHLREITAHNNPFFYHLAVNVLSIKPAAGIFGNIIRDTGDAPPGTLDIKRAIMPLTGFARAYALKHSIPATNTLARIDGMFARGLLLRSEYERITQMYHCLMTFRFHHQVRQIRDNIPPDNFIAGDVLTDLDRAIIRKIFSQIATLQTKLGFDFKGSGG